MDRNSHYRIIAAHLKRRKKAESLYGYPDAVVLWERVKGYPGPTMDIIKGKIEAVLTRGDFRQFLGKKQEFPLESELDHEGQQLLVDKIRDLIFKHTPETYKGVLRDVVGMIRMEFSGSQLQVSMPSKEVVFESIIKGLEPIEGKSTLTESVFALDTLGSYVDKVYHRALPHLVREIALKNNLHKNPSIGGLRDIGRQRAMENMQRIQE